MRQAKMHQQSDHSPLIPIILGGIASGVGSGVLYPIFWRASGHADGSLEQIAIGLVALSAIAAACKSDDNHGEKIPGSAKKRMLII